MVYGVRPEHLDLRQRRQRRAAEVVVVEPTGAEMLVVNRFAGSEVQAVFRERYQLKPGDKIGLSPSSSTSTSSTSRAGSGWQRERRDIGVGRF